MGRENRHLAIIRKCLPKLEGAGYSVTQFHHHSRMPKSLKGVPDLYIMQYELSYWIEIKPKYANYMRDQMSTVQWEWFHERKEKFSPQLRYAIVTDEEELLQVALIGWDSSPNWIEPCFYMPEYHWGRYEQWRRGR